MNGDNAVITIRLIEDVSISAVIESNESDNTLNFQESDSTLNLTLSALWQGEKGDKGDAGTTGLTGLSPYLYPANPIEFVVQDTQDQIVTFNGKVAYFQLFVNGLRQPNSTVAINYLQATNTSTLTVPMDLIWNGANCVFDYVLTNT